MSLKIINLRLPPHLLGANELTHWGRVAHICVSKLTIIDSDDGLSPGRCQAIIWTNAGILLIPTLGTNFNEILSENQWIIHFHSRKIHWKMSSGKWQPFCLGLNVLIRSWPECGIYPGFSCNPHHDKYACCFLWPETPPAVFCIQPCLHSDGSRSDADIS